MATFGYQTAIDVTQLSKGRRFTGIQRVALELIKGNPHFRLVIFSPTTGEFHEITREAFFERVVVPTESRRAPLILGAAWALISSLRYLALCRSTWRRAKKILSPWYERCFAGVSALQTDGFSEAELQRIDPGFKLWLLDIPASREHLEALTQVAGAGTLQLFAYVYDVIPLESPSATGESRDAEVRRHFLEYVSLLGQAAGIMFLSHYTSRRFRALTAAYGIPCPKNYAVSYPPLGDFFTPLHGRGRETNEQAGAEIDRFLKSNSGPLVVCVAPLTRRKNVRVVLAALFRMLSAGSRVRMLAVIPGSSEMDLKACLLALILRALFPHRVLFLSSIPEQTLKRVYRQAKVVTVPSKLEGFGLPALEGIHFECRVIASNVGVMRELSSLVPIQLVDPDAVQEWKDAIEIALQMPDVQAVPASTVLPDPALVGNRMQNISRNSVL